VEFIVRKAYLVLQTSLEVFISVESIRSQGRWETRLEHRTARSCASKNTKVLSSRRIQTNMCVPRRTLLAHALTIRLDGGWAVVAFGLLKSYIAADPSYFVHRGVLNKTGWSALLTNLEKSLRASSYKFGLGPCQWKPNVTSSCRRHASLPQLWGRATFHSHPREDRLFCALYCSVQSSSRLNACNTGFRTVTDGGFNFALLNLAHDQRSTFQRCRGVVDVTICVVHFHLRFELFWPFPKTY
jgi:hypothetical protein